MWKEQTPRQVYELFRTYEDLHKEDKPSKTTKSGESRTTQIDSNGYEVVGKVKIPEWLKSRIPKGATVYSADAVTQEQMMG